MKADFSLYELQKAIHKLKTKKAPGPDGITNEMLKHLSPAAKEALLFIFNQSWKKGTVPNTWKEAIIIPVAKKGKFSKKQRFLCYLNEGAALLNF